MRREAASICIQKNTRAHRARMCYTKLQASATVIQTGLRAMDARNKHRHKRRTKAAIIVQVLRFGLLDLKSLFSNDQNFLDLTFTISD